jgi:predicted PurR-regulated permease PerM
MRKFPTHFDKDIIMQWLRNAAYILIVILGGGFLLLAGRDILFPFLFALFFAFLLMPLEAFLYRKIPSKAFSITTSVLLVLAVVSGIIFLFGYQFIQIVSDMNSIQQQLQDGVEAILAFIEEKVPFVVMPQDQASMNQMMSRIMEAPIDYIGAGITSGAGFLFNLALTFLYTVFILIYKEAFRDFFIIQFPKDKREELEVILNQSVHLIQRYLVGMVTVVILLAILNCTGLLIIGVEHAIFWGVLAACLVIIPYIGTTLGGILPFLYSLATAEYSWQPFAVVIMYVIIQQVEGNFITPKIVGSSVRINPFFALFGIVVFGSLMGIGGIVLAIPMLALLKLVAEEIDVLKPIALLMDKDLMKKRHLFLGKYDRDDYRLSSIMREEEGKR